MKIVGFPLDVSHSQDDRIVRGLRIRRTFIQVTIDLIQAGDVEPTAGAISTIAGLSSKLLVQHFCTLPDLYAAAFDLAVSRALQQSGSVDAAAPLTKRIELLVCDRVRLFEEWLPLLRFADRVCKAAPAVGLGIAQLRRALRDRLAVCFSAELGTLSPSSRDLVLDSLDIAFGLDSWINMRARQRLSPGHASRNWRFTAQAIVLQALNPSDRPLAAA